MFSIQIPIYPLVFNLFSFLPDTWEREDTKGNWTEYSKAIVYLLEAASMVGLNSVKFKEHKKELIADLTKKVQTTKTGRGLKNIHRIKASDAGKWILTCNGCHIITITWWGIFLCMCGTNRDMVFELFWSKAGYVLCTLF